MCCLSVGRGGCLEAGLGGVLQLSGGPWWMSVAGGGVSASILP
jgi:hypothetical protein